MPSKPKCSIYGCRSNWRTHKGMVFFRFPVPDSPMYDKWLSKCAESAERIKNSYRVFVCSKHFHKENVRGKRLMPGSVPEFHLKASAAFKEEEKKRLAENVEQERIKKLVEETTLEWVKRVMALPKMSNTCPSANEVMHKAKVARNFLGAHLFLRTEVHWSRNFRRLYLENLKPEDCKGREGKSLEVKDIILELSPNEKILNEEEMNALWMEEKIRAVQKRKRRRNEKRRLSSDVEEVEEDTKQDQNSIESDSSDCYEVKSEEDSIEISSNVEDSVMECSTTGAVIKSYEQALEYLKPLEDFALQQENYRLIGLLTRMETVLKDPKRGMGP